MRTKEAQVQITRYTRADGSTGRRALAFLDLGTAFDALPVQERDLVIERSFARAADLAKQVASK